MQGFMERARRGLRPTEDQAGRAAVGCHPSRMAVPLLRVGSGGPGAKALCGSGTRPGRPQGRAGKSR